jgi:lipopolysaccharide/colanic/teichoic acid biosynthesis glycosyltransferase
MNAVVKRLLDLLISVPLVIVLFPLLLVVAFAIRIESPGPAFFVQPRRGKDFKVFSMIKFRSLLHNAPDPHEKYEMLEDDPRITRVGRLLRKTSLDELPQLFNVIAGTMSMVGPRPLVEWESQLSLPRFAERYRVKPGITGLSQLIARNTVDFDARCALDLEYVQKQSVLLDILLIIKTPFALLRSEGIYPNAGPPTTAA